MMVIYPLHVRGQTHQDAFYPAVGFQAEQGAFVVHQVEFHITAPADLLPGPVLRSVLQVFPFFNNWNISLQEAISYISHILIPVFEGSCVRGLAIIKKQTSDSPGFFAVGVPEVIIAFFLVLDRKSTRLHSSHVKISY